MILFYFPRPHSCSDCGKSYKDSASFKRHRMTHHHNSNLSSSAEIDYDDEEEEEDASFASVAAASVTTTCPHCPEKFSDSTQARRHLRLAHPSLAGDSREEEENDDEEEEEEVDDEEMEQQQENITLNNDGEKEVARKVSQISNTRSRDQIINPDQ